MAGYTAAFSRHIRTGTYTYIPAQICAHDHRDSRLAYGPYIAAHVAASDLESRHGAHPTLDKMASFVQTCSKALQRARQHSKFKALQSIPQPFLRHQYTLECVRALPWRLGITNRLLLYAPRRAFGTLGLWILPLDARWLLDYTLNSAICRSDVDLKSGCVARSKSACDCGWSNQICLTVDWTMPTANQLTQWM